MTRISVDGLGRAGFLPDPTGHDIVPEGWTDVRNIRFKNGDAYRVPGVATAWGGLPIQGRFLLPVENFDTKYWVYAGETKVYVTDGVNHTNISKTAGAFNYGAAGENQWSGGVFHQVPFLNNPVDHPQVWNPVNPASYLTDMPDWPATWRVKVMRPYKNFLIGLQQKIGAGAFDPQSVIWSNPADPGTMPSSWDYTNPANDAGRTTLADTPGEVLDCMPLGDFNIVYKNDAIYRMSFVGAPYIFKFDKVTDKYGLLAPGAMASFANMHFVVGKSDMYIHDGQTIVPTGQDQTKEWFYRNISRQYYWKMKVRSYPRHSEIWIAFPTEGATWLDKALIYNYKDKTWTTRDLPNIADFQLGFIPPDFISTWDNQEGGWNLDEQIWEDDTSNWDEGQLILWAEAKRTWDEVAGDPNSDNLIGVGGATTEAYVFEGANAYLGDEYSSVLERQGIAVVGRDREGRPITDFRSMKILREVWPKIEGSDPVDIYVGGQDYKNGPIFWEGPYRFDPRVDEKIDCVVSGKLLCIRFHRRLPGLFRISGYVLDMELTGDY